MTEASDRLAWMQGWYAGRAFHAPDKYPRAPAIFTPPQKRMTDAEMLEFMRKAGDALGGA